MHSMAFFWELTRHGLGLGLLYRLWDRAFRQGAWFRSARYVEIRLLHRSLVIMRRCAPCRRLEADPAHASMLSDHPAAEACGCYAQPGLPVPMFRHARYRPGLTWSTVRACFYVYHFYNTTGCQNTPLQPVCFRWWCHPTPPMRTSAG
jgi:hypothetical protein